MAQKVEAALPWGNVTAGSLQTTQASFSFDPLALLAVLHNLRADASAARLYHQHHADVYRWKHTMMVGGALPPFKLLIDHLASQKKSIHPTMELFKADTGRLDVKSNIGFSSLPISHGNMWLADLLDFQPSAQPQNDILIVHLDSIHGEFVAVKDDLEAKSADSQRARIYLNTIDGLIPCLLTTGVVCSALTGDMWAVVLFSAYLLHCLASITVSFCDMVSTRGVEGRQIQEDSSIHFAVYTRRGGGKVIFKGRKDTLETWARMTWTYQARTLNNAVHWIWMVTGSLSAAASVVCMVNMAGHLQLAYLAVLAISSACEIVITRIVRHVQRVAIHHGDARNIFANDKWSQAVIRSALEVDDRWSLDELPWLEFGFFPDRPAFRNLCALLPKLRTGVVPSEKSVIQSEMSKGIMDPHETSLAKRMVVEIAEVQLRKRRLK